MSISEFIDTCLKLDKSNDMKVIVEKKVKKHFNLCNVNYTSSQEFQDLMKEKIALLESKPDLSFIVIKDVVDELRLRKQKVNTEPPVKRLKVDTGSSQTKEDPEEETEENAVKEIPKDRQRILKKLKKLLLILHKKIAKLETKEVNWDDDNNSSYIQVQRYRDRIVAVYKKINEYEGGTTNFNKLNYRKISFTGTPFPNVNSSIEKFVNKTGQFPDYTDILKILEKTCEEENISLSQTRLNNMAKSAFQEIGEQLQRRRQFEFWNAHSLYLGSEEDPAAGDADLEKALEDNRKKYSDKINEVIDKYAEEAESQKLEPEEVPEDCCDKSPEEKSEGDEESGEGSGDESGDEGTEEEDVDYVDNVISDKKRATSSCEEISDNEDSDASGEVVLDDVVTFDPTTGEEGVCFKEEASESDTKSGLETDIVEAAETVGSTCEENGKTETDTKELSEPCEENEQEGSCPPTPEVVAYEAKLSKEEEDGSASPISEAVNEPEEEDASQSLVSEEVNKPKEEDRSDPPTSEVVEEPKETILEEDCLPISEVIVKEPNADSFDDDIIVLD